MKKIIIILLGAILLTIGACKKMADFNKDSKSATAVPSSALFANSLKDLVDQETSANVNLNDFREFSQYWTETTYPDESNYDLTTRQIPDFEFRNIYRNVLANLKETKRVIANETSLESSAAEKANKTAVTEILSVYAFQREVDIFGNIPYSQALDITVINPAYDDAQAIYSQLFSRLDAAIASIDVASAGFADGDLIYSGDMGKWKTFAYSLKLKMAITVADVPALDPAGKAASALAGGVMASSSDNATFPYLSTSPNTNPIWVDLVASGRYDFVPANTIVDIMDTLNDPRRPFYFDSTTQIGGTYVGGIYGANNTYANYTHLTTTIQAPNWRGLLMSYSEIQFYLSEAAARGLISGTPDTYYNAGITASIVDDWGGLATDATAYLANPKVAYATATGTYKQKIAVQSWISSYDRGLLGWTTWRRLDAPAFNIAPSITSKTDIPTRFTYPIGEQTLNGTNYTAAAAAIGGDKLNTHLFWDKF